MNTTTYNASLSSVSHDLRNYLSGISGMIDLITHSINSYKKAQEAKGIKVDDSIKEISECALLLSPYSKEALHFVDDLMNVAFENKNGSDDISEESSTFKTREPVLCNIGELIKELLIFNESLILKHKVFVHTDIQNNLPYLKCDILRLKQILINLIVNAIKYSHQGGLVKILAYLKYNQICVEISDNGIGMNDEEVALALSGNGKQIDKSALNKDVPIDSHGIGLPNVIELVELLNGKIEISSEKNRGTRITLLFNQTL